MQEILSKKSFYVDLSPRHAEGQSAELLSFNAKFTLVSDFSVAQEPVSATYDNGVATNCVRQPNGAFRIFFPATTTKGQWDIHFDIDYKLVSSVFSEGVRISSDHFDLPYQIVKQYSCPHQSQTVLQYPQIEGNSVFNFALVVDSVKGEPGKSAYLAAKDGGYTLSESIFNTTLATLPAVKYRTTEWQPVNQVFESTQGNLLPVKCKYLNVSVAAGVLGEVRLPTGTIHPIISVRGYAQELRSNNHQTHCISSFNIFTRWQDNPSDYSAYIVIPRAATYGWKLKICIEALV